MFQFTYHPGTKNAGEITLNGELEGTWTLRAFSDGVIAHFNTNNVERVYASISAFYKALAKMSS